MPTYVNPNACNACAEEHLGPLCVYICPNDLMVLDTDSMPSPPPARVGSLNSGGGSAGVTGKAFNQEPGLCSECYACVKLCPQEAIHVRGYADFVPLGASVQPRKSPPPPFAKGGDRGIYGLTWTVHFRDGRELQFTYPSRTTPVGSSEPYQGFTEDPVADLKGQGLAGESLWLGVDQLPTPN